MNVELLISTIVRQTTVLIAQVATTAGVRAPLASVANQVFLDLVRELERQGVGRKVVADMFGLALRSYQQKVQRLMESATDGNVTLWEAIYEFVRERQVVSRAEVLQRFQRDDDALVKSILGDLVNTGLVYRAGQSEESVYRFAPPEDLARLNGSTSEAASSQVWTNIYRSGPLRREELAALVPLDGKVLDEALASLLAEGRVQQEQRDTETVYVSKLCFIPLGDSAGWEAALLDHHGALVAAICSKLRNGQTRALPDDQVGGSTFSMDVWPGHPKEEAVTLLLNRFRAELSALWQEIVNHSQSHSAAPGAYRVTFYCGQYVSRDPALEP